MNAIEKVSGPCVILAGAGTGKTYTIVEKIKHLIKNKIYPADKIVCITFSNEAANNLTLRIDKSLEDKSNKPVIRTFHGFSADLLRRYGDKIGLDKKFKILDPDQAKVILHRNLKINAINCHRYIGTIGTAKDLGIKLEDFKLYLDRELIKVGNIDLEVRLESLQFDFQTLHIKKDYSKKKEITKSIKLLKKIIEIKKFVTAWTAYEKLKTKGNYQDYSDLNQNSLLLLEKFPEISLDFEYVIVDEFQDTNKLQLDFLIKLAKHQNITIVGDLNQSIYRFRGAYKDNINLFKKAFSVTDKDIFNLDKSYRSSNKILKVAHKLILNNYQNKEECFFVDNVHNREGDKIEVYQTKNANSEAMKIVELIKKENHETPLEEMCILFRTHQQGRIIKKALENSNIEYFSVSKASLLKQKSVKTAHDYLTIIDKIKRKDKGGEQAWWDLVYNLEFKSEDLIKIGKCIKEYTKNREDKENKDKNKETEVKEPISLFLLKNLDKLDLTEQGKFASKILIEKINKMATNNKPISELLKDIYVISGLINEQKTKEEKEIMLNLNKFYELAKVHEELYDSDLDNFLYYLQVLEDLGIEIEASSLEEKGVRLMTSHATKGLEYKIVIITNFAQGRFPIERYTGNLLIPTELLPEVKEEVKNLDSELQEEYIHNYEKYNQLLEERRLAYVSFTRAKDKLILTYASDYSGKKSGPSMFLDEISYKENEEILLQLDLEEKNFAERIKDKKQLSLSTFINAQDFEKIIIDNNEVKKEEIRRFSPSALMLFDDCQKEFEYKYVFNMPERKTVSWEAMRLGSFVHIVLENGVSSNFNSVNQFLDLAKEMSLDSDWESINLSEAETLIKVFFERNKGKYSNESKTEQYLPLELEGLDFIGFADRIDINKDGVTIIDYKTGKSNVSPRNREWQLGFYALAANEKYGKVKRVVLDMLKLERPLEFEIDDKGNALCISSKFIDSFNINNVKEELIKTAKKIQQAYKTGFKPCPVEKNCEFCNEYVYGL